MSEKHVFTHHSSLITSSVLSVSSVVKIISPNTKELMNHIPRSKKLD